MGARLIVTNSSRIVQGYLIMTGCVRLLQTFIHSTMPLWSLCCLLATGCWLLVVFITLASKRSEIWYLVKSSCTSSSETDRCPSRSLCLPSCFGESRRGTGVAQSQRASSWFATKYVTALLSRYNLLLVVSCCACACQYSDSACIALASSSCRFFFLPSIFPP